MPYTHKSLVCFWAIVFVLFALTGSGLVVDRWPLLVVALAFALPLILRGSAGWTL
jgi:hypothetical protein